MNSQVSHNDQTIETRALRDFCQRTLAGYGSYPVAWLILCQVITNQSQAFMIGNLICLTLIAAVRMIKNRHFARAATSVLSDHGTRLRIQILSVGTLLNAAYFTSLLAYLLSQNISAEGVATIVVLLAFIAPSGALTFSIYKPLCDAFFLIMFVIPLGVYFALDYPYPWAAILAILTGYLYISVTARRFNHDYWAYNRLNHQLGQYVGDLEQENRLDPLTGMNNRRYFNERLQIAWMRARRDQQPLTIMMIDIDHFKQINDRFGHDTGDRVLINISAQIRQNFNRATDTLARYGGEEFIVLLENTESAECLPLTEKLRDQIAATQFDTANAELNCTISVGIASHIPDEKMTPQDLIKQADMALYKAKNTGRNRIASY